jgi:hypothetical protein
MYRFLIISDFSHEKCRGGAEINNEILLNLLNEAGHFAGFIETKDFNLSFDSYDHIDLFIVSNFFFISEAAENYLISKKYLIIEHDYKFVANRNPFTYPEFRVPATLTLHKALYLHSVSVLTQSRLHKNIFELNNIPSTSFGGNLWTQKDLLLIQKLATKPKNGKFCILGPDDYGIKGRDISIKFCEEYNIDYDLIPKLDGRDFLEKLSEYSVYVFFPQSPETFSRVSAEAKMMNLGLICNDNVGCMHEEYFYSSPQKIREIIQNKPKELLQIIYNLL